MNSVKQFWALFRFQSTINPFIWIMPLALGAPFLITYDLPHSYHPSFSSLLTVQNLFFVGIIGAITLVPEKFRFGGGSETWTSGTEFLVTRAIDRRILLRSKSTFFTVLVMVIPLVLLLLALKRPALQVTEYSDTARQLCLQSVPGSILLPDPNGNRAPLISIPQGSVLIEEWHCWLFFGSIMGVQALILLLYPLKHRVPIFYTVYLASVFGPMLWDEHAMSSRTPSIYQRTFFSYASHPVEFWVLTLIVFMLCQWWCERRFARLEP